MPWGIGNGSPSCGRRRKSRTIYGWTGNMKHTAKTPTGSSMKSTAMASGTKISGETQRSWDMRKRRGICRRRDRPCRKNTAGQANRSRRRRWAASWSSLGRCARRWSRMRNTGDSGVHRRPMTSIRQTGRNMSGLWELMKMRLRRKWRRSQPYSRKTRGYILRNIRKIKGRCNWKQYRNNIRSRRNIRERRSGRQRGIYSR